MTSSSYGPPVESLLNYGTAHAPSEWPDYVKKLGLRRAHVPDLARMVDDPALYLAAEDTPQASAPTHAWRSLAQLHALDVIAPMLRLIEAESSVLAYVEFPKVMATVGSAAIAELAAVLADKKRPDQVRAAAAKGLAAIAAHDPKSRAKAVKQLTERLRKLRDNSSDLNTAIVQALVDMKAREARPSIEAAFEEQEINPSLLTWDDVEAALGPESK